MENVTSILVVFDGGGGDLPLLTKAAMLARAFSARLEFFSCDAEHEFTLRHSYVLGANDWQRVRTCPAPLMFSRGRVAEQRYDALVLGALAHRTRQGALVGTLTRKLMEALDSDFVLIRHVSPMSQGHRS